MLEQDLSTRERKIGQLLFVGIPGTGIDEVAAALLSEINPGGVCLFGRNIRSREQTRQLLDALWAVLDRPFLSVDQEGGLVDRLKRILPAMPAAAKLASPDQAAEQARLMGESMRLLGFNMDFAPVVDVMSGDRGKAGNGLYTRTYSADADDVSAFAGAFSNSLRNERILDCIKHFPGLGASQVDSHEELPSVDIEEDELESIDLVPYGRLLSMASSVMVAHAAFPRHPLQEKDSKGRFLPSSLSGNFVTLLLRERLRFGGVVITDDLEMGAIMRNYGIGEAAKMAVTAGADMLAICAEPENIRAAYRALLAAVESGEIAEARIDESVARIAAAKKDLNEPSAWNPERLDLLASEMADFAARF